MGGVIMYEAPIDPPVWVGAVWRMRYQNTGLDRMDHYVRHWSGTTVTFHVPTAGLSGYWGEVTCEVPFNQLHSRMQFNRPTGAYR